MPKPPARPSPFRPVAAILALLLSMLLPVVPPLAPSAAAQTLAGKLWDSRAARFITASELVTEMSAAHWLLLGEVHDNPHHHRLRRDWLEALAAGARKPALAMEQFDREHQQALDQASRAQGAAVDDLRKAGQFSDRGWDWPSYAPFVQIALDRRLQLVAANLSRREAFRVASEGPDPVLGETPAAALLRARPLPASAVARLEAVLHEGHCGKAPAHILPGMVLAQRARDAVMAQAMIGAGDGGAVLIAGNGHVRRDFGVPHYLGEMPPARKIITVGLLEIREGAADPRQYYRGDDPEYDFIAFTPRQAREDPCATLSFRPRQPTAQP